MKKTLLLAGVACLFSYSANAMDLSQDLKPYVGLDYVYSHANYKNDASRLEKNKFIKDDYNSGAINAGVMIDDYTSIEAFYQQSGTRKGDTNYVDGVNHKAKTKFNAYGLDIYGYLPMGCSDFSLLGTVGAANYDLEIKNGPSKETSSRIGYRAGVGAQYKFNENWSARVVGRYSYIGTKQVDNLMEATAGIRYTF